MAPSAFSKVRPTVLGQSQIRQDSLKTFETVLMGQSQNIGLNEKYNNLLL